MKKRKIVINIDENQYLTLVNKIHKLNVDNKMKQPVSFSAFIRTLIQEILEDERTVHYIYEKTKKTKRR